jgi:hypothetical protein
VASGPCSGQFLGRAIRYVRHSRRFVWKSRHGCIAQMPEDGHYVD